MSWSFGPRSSLRDTVLGACMRLGWSSESHLFAQIRRQSSPSSLYSVEREYSRMRKQYSLSCKFVFSNKIWKCFKDLMKSQDEEFLKMSRKYTSRLKFLKMGRNRWRQCSWNSQVRNGSGMHAIEADFSPFNENIPMNTICMKTMHPMVRL